MAIDSATQAACLACLDRFMAAVNAHDLVAMEREMHFPHARIALGTIVTYSAPGSNPFDLFERLQREDGWYRSEWLGKNVVQGYGNKVHVVVRYRRLRRDGSVIGDYDSLYILTRLHDRWGIQARSSFGPSPRSSTRPGDSRRPTTTRTSSRSRRTRACWPSASARTCRS